MLGIFLQYLQDLLDHASDCEGIIGELAAPENTESFEANLENYTTVHILEYLTTKK